MTYISVMIRLGELTSLTVVGRIDREEKRGRTSAAVLWSNRDGEGASSGMLRRLITASEPIREEYGQSGGPRLIEQKEADRDHNPW